MCRYLVNRFAIRISFILEVYLRLGQVESGIHWKFESAWVEFNLHTDFAIIVVYVCCFLERNAYYILYIWATWLYNVGLQNEKVKIDKHTQYRTNVVSFVLLLPQCNARYFQVSEMFPFCKSPSGVEARRESWQQARKLVTIKWGTLVRKFKNLFFSFLIRILDNPLRELLNTEPKA